MALGHIGLYKIPIEKKDDVTKKNTKIYPNIYKYIQDRQDIYKIVSGGWTVRSGPARRRRPGPARAKPPGRAGPAAADKSVL